MVHDSAPPPVPKSQRPAGVSVTTVLLLLVVALLVVRSDWSSIFRSRSLLDPTAAAKPLFPRGNLAEDEKATIELFRRCSPSVVHISSLSVQRSQVFSRQGDVQQGSGSGFIWDKGGYIVTNYHVIENAFQAVENGRQIEVTLSDNSRWDARLTGAAMHKDIAVLKIEAPADRLVPLQLGNSDELEVGQKVFAIGNPFGFDKTLTTGVISRLNNQILSPTKRPIDGVIQTDAAINPGSSGGPLLDSSGYLIGVTTAIYSPSGASAGIGFAVPSNIVNEVVPQIIRTGQVENVGMGIEIGPNVTARLRGPNGESISLAGVMIEKVREGLPAEKAGMRGMGRDANSRIVYGDVITGVDSQTVRTETDLFRALSKRKAGDKITVKAYRQGTGEMEFSVTLIQLP